MNECNFKNHYDVGVSIYYSDISNIDKLPPARGVRSNENNDNIYVFVYATTINKFTIEYLIYLLLLVRVLRPYIQRLNVNLSIIYIYFLYLIT